MDAGTSRPRGAKTAIASIAFVMPWLLLAMGSPLYVENWMPPTLGLWAVGVIAGGLLMIGSQSRQTGKSVLGGTLIGAGLFVLLFTVLLFIAPI